MAVFLFLFPVLGYSGQCDEDTTSQSLCSYKELAAAERDCANVNDALHSKWKPVCDIYTSSWKCSQVSSNAEDSSYNVGLDFSLEVAPSKMKTNQPQGPRVMWWNIEGVVINKQSLYNDHKCQIKELNANLRKFLLMPEHSPDTLVLGEFHYGMLEERTLSLLNQMYPYKIVEEYGNVFNGLGIAVFSRYPLNLKRKERLDWTPLDYSQSERQAYREAILAQQPADERGSFDKIYLNIEVQAPGKTYNLIPVHMNMPWKLVKAANSYSSDYIPDFVCDAIASGSTAYEILQGEGNPLVYQVEHLKKFLAEDFGSNYNQEEFVMVGDFNVPPTLKLIPTEAYNMLSENLNDHLSDESLYTFPTPAASEHGDYPEMRIDHAFSNMGSGSVKAKVLPLDGSDHFPIHLTIK